MSLYRSKGCKTVLVMLICVFGCSTYFYVDDVKFERRAKKDIYLSYGDEAK